MARCLILQSGLPLTHWAEAVATACYTRNRCPSSSLDGASPYEKWTGEIPNVNCLRSFGSKVFILDKNPTKDKFAARNSARPIDGAPRERTSPVLADVPRTPERPMQPRTPERRAPGRPRLLRTGNRGRPRKVYQTISEGAPNEDDVLTEVVADELEDDVFREVNVAADDMFAGVAEVSIREAMMSEEENEWEEAILLEVESLVKNDTLKIVKKPEDKKVVGSRIVLTNKYGPDGSIAKRKARIVAKGYSQRYGVDYHYTFAPVARLDSIRLMLALAAELGLTIWQFDVVTAFLNGYLDEEVYMQLPDMLMNSLEKLVLEKNSLPEVKNRAENMLKELHAGGNACRLNKALYGLRQAGRQWNIRLDAKLKKMGLAPTR
ncbi:PREDICTED: uncharacterized protein LOC105560616, partial [Vollenhovia emeryi]|uniref:uncharacterized protein LOC105560616 n=1 Tax=Vollenhovia emeryi TaxID=411798 RepID=UPI0005F472AF